MKPESFAIYIIMIPAVLSFAGIRADAQEPSRKEILERLANPETADSGDFMEFEDRILDFGTIEEDGGPVSGIFKWHNAGDRPVSLVKVNTTCSCAVPEYSREYVSPGDTGTLKITFHPQGHPGKISRKIIVFSTLSEDKPTAVLELAGDVIPSVRPTWNYPYAMGPLLLKQKEINMTGTSLQTERILCMNAGEKDITVKAETELLPEGFTFRCEPETIVPDGEADLIFVFDPSGAKLPPAGVIPVILKIPGLTPSQRTIFIKINK